ncbi:CPBP family intramembrane glutamic endopeptidase [Aureitalea marina]|nr:CPBP family intramembrane glutamic endopeptidase [Aureitalea marina]
MALGLIGLCYILFLLFKVIRIRFKPQSLQWKPFIRQTAVKFLVIAVVTTVYVYLTDATNLFYVPLNRPELFGIILMIYTFLSVWPQEVIYRTFFFERYQSLFSDQRVFVLINALLFSLAHIFFRNTLVVILTFIGGLLFAVTYLRFRSTLLVSLEHAIYGNWLFTVGMGEMLAFPGMEAG